MLIRGTLNGKYFEGEHFRAFPISNWTEMDVWNYLKRENIAIPSLYKAHQRDVVWRNDSWIPVSKHLILQNDESIKTKTVGEWKKRPPDIHKRPTVFILSRD